ncbi:MAG: hypothetical protein A2268_13045 [Candidatus Raymondbacteria bacterium RifOxyA12_full_50_37]|uniref:tRNA-uridine aminocarboxypropyltransferase n=1 Tax=Candidatus Raymondbacteria bacterium RIFOXYD12_FULL_49_13 TaxID=1817890 RepID=A0A1F7EZT2_UNCRA|nr:MAG: hypothetical protein A2268_13045 [Candidatus Raymondbacteria bacterium RifOxyA12_full_50_37]OGJ92990.1 MAG: hypothetical protein A2248_18180 [Candidatus Raymondbacteria bacterium RIFOXYA2_FULL_49_16]OGJ95230.1 MAG: hypothetical protein A2350_13580 [Candidatus Raymondbacteria bacterium RifOxyB12_full_50_8]OGJ97670.1 MAG: hypothetical protein A2487_13170 [Candidatus Raymondbacteria bacterium RifOxyC12_full_50_8]OGJ99903.1 MAG: hypothetical protein A2519_00160 [Candidatus Raymondbacteria b
MTSPQNKIIRQIAPEKPQRDRCLRCNRGLATCFCGFARPFDTHTRFVLLMHPKEFKRQTTGTGRLTHVALRNSEIIMGCDFSGDLRLSRLLSDPRYYPVLLFPGPGAINLSENEALPLPCAKKLLVFLIDGTWATAKRILKLNENLSALPKIRFSPAAPSRFRFKRQPAAHCVSTIEAAYYILCLLESQGLEKLNNQHATLIEALDSLVDFQVRFLASASRK